MMRNQAIKRLIIVILAVFLVGTGGFVAINYISSNRFNPDTSDVNDVKINDVGIGDDKKDADSDNHNDSDDLVDKKDGDASSGGVNNKKIFVKNQSNKYSVENNGNGSNAQIGNADGDVINVANNGNSDNSVSTGDGNQGNGGTQGNGDSHNGSSANSGNSDTKPSNPGDNGDTNVIYPQTPNYTEPDKTIPDDIYDEWDWLPTVPTYKDDNPSNSSETLSLKVELAETDIIPSIENLEFYEGEELDDYKLLCRVWAYAVADDGTEKYRFREISDNFYIKDYPQTATNGFSVTFCFRQTAMSEWQEQTITIPTVERKLLVASYKEGYYPSVQSKESKYLYPEKNASVNLLELYGYFYEVEVSGLNIDQLFRGWSEEVNGVPIDDEYVVNRDGIIYLYPTGYVDIPNEYKAKLVAYLYSDDIEWWQTICDYNGDDKAVTIPKYVQCVQFDKMTELDEITLPLSTKLVVPENSDSGERTLHIKQRYIVSQDSKYLSTIDGALASKDKTVIYDIPSEIKSFSVPESVTEIKLSELNSDMTELVFHSADVPNVDISNLKNAKLYVPKDSLFDYLNAWGSSIGTNEILPSDGSTPEYVYVNGAILSDFGRTLCAVDDKLVGTLVVPDCVERLPAGVITNENIDSIVFGKEFRELENGAINADNITKLYFLGNNTVSVGSESISVPSGNDIDVYVQADIADEFVSAWTEAMGDRASSIVHADNMSLATYNGFTLFCMNDGAIIFDAPKDIVAFDENTLGTVNVKAIGSNAFKECNDLRFVDLAESIKYIGKQAFMDCNSLEGVFSYSEDEITVDKQAFSNYKSFNTTLKYVVFNAQEGYIDEDFQNINRAVFFAPANANGYNRDGVMHNYISFYANRGADSYLIERQGDERIVYAYSDYLTESGAGYIVCAASTGIGGTVTFPNGTKVVNSYAFANCKNEFKLKNTDELEYIFISGFESSGISGSYNFKSLTKIEMCCFSDCKYLEKIEFPVLTVIPNTAFSGSTALTEIECGDKLTQIASNSFVDCQSFKKLTLSSEEPVELFNMNWGSIFYFGTNPYYDTFDESNFRVVLKGKAKENQQAYLDHWYVNLFGFEYEYAMFIDFFYYEEDMVMNEERISSMFDVEFHRP